MVDCPAPPPPDTVAIAISNIATVGMDDGTPAARRTDLPVNGGGGKILSR